jgi:hypothetical protein
VLAQDGPSIRAAFGKSTVNNASNLRWRALANALQSRIPGAPATAKLVTNGI